MKGRRFLLKLNNDKNDSFSKSRLIDGKGILFLFTFVLFTLFSSSIFGQACSLVNLPNNLKNGLVAYYPFCGNYNDISGNNNALQAFGLTATTDRFGVSASAYSFSNTQTVVTSYLKATNPTPFAKSTYTISAWFNSNQFYPSVGGLTYNYQSIVSYAPQHYTWGPAYNLQLLNGDNTTLTASQWTSANLFQSINTNTGTITTTQWYHAVVTYDGTTLKMFRDGVLVGSRAATIDFANQVQFLIGANGDGPNPGGLYGGFNGKLDDIGFWDRPLDVCEVMQLYNLTATNPQPSTSFNPLAAITSQCATSVVLNAGSGYTSYQWSTGSNIATTTITMSGNYKVTVINSDGCVSSDSTFVSLLQANILNNDTIICKNSSATLKIDSLINGTGFSSLYQLPTSLKNGLVAYYPFNGNSNDVSGNNNNGVITSVSTTADRFGTANNAYQFSGGNIAVPMTSELAMTGDRTFSCWFKANGSQTGGRIYENTYLNSGIALYNGNKLDAWHCSNGQSRNVTNVNSGTLSEWHHLVYVADATNSLGKVYIDGALSGTMSATSSACPNNWLGAYMRFGLGASGEVFNGSLDDIGIWNRTLTATEIRQLYNNNISVTWSTGATTNVIVVNPTQTTTYTATVSDGITSCQEQIVVTVPTDPTITTSGSSAICDGTSVQLTSSSTTGNAWYKNGQPILVGGNGQRLTVSQAGVYSLTTTTTINNCVNTSTNSITVTIIPLPTIGINTLPVAGVVCKGDDITLNGTGAITYTWSGGVNDGVAFPAIQSGTYTVTGTDANGCVNTATTNITVNNASPVSIAMTPSAGIICANDSVTLLATGSLNYTWDRGITNGQKFNPTVTRLYTVIGTDANGCKDTATKTVTVTNLPNLTITMVPESGIICLNDSMKLIATGANNYRWSQGIINGQKFNPTTTGVYTVVGTDVNGCSNTISTTVQVNSLPVVTIGLIPASGIICLKDSATLTATGAVNYIWDNGVVNGQTFNPNSTRSYTVIGTDVNGCTATASKNIQVLPLPNVWVSMVPDEAIVCANTNVVLSGNGAVSYTWDNGVVNGQTFNPTTTNNYTVVGTGANGCKNTVVRNIEVLPQPLIKAIASDTSICEGGSIKLSASGGIAYTWSDNVNDGVSFIPTKAQNYYVSGIDINGCQNLDSIYINVNKIPVVNILNSVVCDGAPSPLVAKVNSGLASDYNYSWFAPNYVKLPDIENNITVFKPGTYSAIAVNKISKCASLPTEAMVTFNPIPVVGAITTATNTVLVDNEFTLNANPNVAKQPISYAWSLSDPTKAIIISGNKDVLLKAIGKGKLDVTYHITDGNNCISKESEVLQMTINQTAMFVVPSAFSPNNDGLNDYLNIIAKSSLKGLNYFKIFNRYGVLVYDTKEIKYGWDGRLNGIMQEADVYYWIAEYTTIDGETIKTSGQSVLIK